MESLGEIAVTAQRNRSIKKILSTHFGKGKVRVRGHGADWVVKIDTAPTSVEHQRELESKVWELINGSNIGLGIKEVDDGIWLVSFMHYDLGYIDLEQRTLQTIDNPFGTRLSPMS